MQTWSPEFLLMTTSTRSVSWFGDTNPPCAGCCVNLLEQMSLSQMIWPSKHFFARIKTSAASAVKRAFPRGFTGSPTIVFEKMHAAGRNWLESTKHNSRHNTIPRWPILV